MRCLREGISGDRVVAFFGILNGTCNYILTEMEKRGVDLATVLRGSAEQGVRGGRSELRYRRLRRALQAGAAGGAGVRREDHAFGYFHGRHPPDHAGGFPLRAPVEAHRPADLRRAADAGGIILSVRPALIPVSTILAGVQGAYNAVWVKGKYGEDTFYYGWGAGALPTGVAVVSDLMRVAREIRSGSPERVSPFAHERLGENKPLSISQEKGRLLSAFPRRRPAGDYRQTGGHPGGQGHFVWRPSCRNRARIRTTCRLS